jgi:hypothetical protein
VWLLRWWSDLARDLRYAFRGMRRDAAFTAFVIVKGGVKVFHCGGVKGDHLDGSTASVC